MFDVGFVLAHPSEVAAPAAIAAAAGWGVAQYLNKREIGHHKRQIGEHARDLAELEEQCKAGSLLDADFPSIGRLEPKPVPIGLPQTAEYHREFNIVLTRTPPAAFWAFRKSTLKEVFSEWFGSSLTTNMHLNDGYGLIGGGDEERPCLLWKGTREVSVENSEVMKLMYPFVIVRSVPHEAGTDRTTEELFNFIHWLQMWDKAMPNSRFEIVKMHRMRNKAYLRGYYRFTGLEIRDNLLKSAKKYDEYFVMRQLFVSRSDNYTTIISAGLPNRELVTDTYFEPLRAWWEALMLVQASGPCISSTCR